MILTHNMLDLAHYLNNGQAPFDFIERKLSEKWYVPHTPINLDRPVDWRFFEKDRRVCIPMFPYLTQPDPAAAVGFALQLGLRCAMDFRSTVKALHVSIGYPTNEVYENTGHFWQHYIGLAVLLEKQ